MEAYVTGYGDGRFPYPVSQSLHYNICTNVIRDPVMCRENEHVFCRACITRYLVNYQRCPTCMEPLTVDTLLQVSRNVRDILSALKIRCHFFNRGCGESMPLADLERHVRDCGYAPAVCSNEGCEVEVNHRDLLHHETAVCELRRVHSQSCNDIAPEMDTLKVNLATIYVNLDRNEKNVEKIAVKLESMEAKVEIFQGQLNQQEESNRQLKSDNEEMKRSLNEITRRLERMTQQTSPEVHAEQAREMKKGNAESVEVDREPKVVVAGGYGNGSLNSVEMFCLSSGTWTPLQPLKERRHSSSSVVYSNQILLLGGLCGSTSTNSMESLSMNAVEVENSIHWEDFPATLPGRMYSHSSVVYNGRLFLIGGFNRDKCACCNSITEISLVPPYTSKQLTTVPERWCHGVALFGDKIVIVGGREDMLPKTTRKTVLLYDITKNECQELAPLPYAVYHMATVKWGDDNVVVIGGVNAEGQALNTVVVYNVKTQQSHRLPDMKYKRQGCVAVVVRDTIIVFGGGDEERNYLKSVECFKFDKYSWEELPEMHEERCWATAVVC